VRKRASCADLPVAKKGILPDGEERARNSFAGKGAKPTTEGDEICPHQEKGSPLVTFCTAREEGRCFSTFVTGGKRTFPARKKVP